MNTMTRFSIWRRGEADAYAAGQCARSVMRQARGELRGLVGMILTCEAVEWITPRTKAEHVATLKAAALDFEETRGAALTMIERGRDWPGFREGYRHG